MQFLTFQQHEAVLTRLSSLPRPFTSIQTHPAGWDYTSLMVWFLLHNLSAAESLFRLSSSFGYTWFPAIVAYTVARTMFEIDVTSHYISRSPADRASQYIEFSAMLSKREMEACRAHRDSPDSEWREAMNRVWTNDWAAREQQIQERYEAVRSKYTRTTGRGKSQEFANWSGKSLRQMAREVDHLEPYDIFYAELSSFTHADVRLADRFLKVRPEGPMWTQRTKEADLGHAFRFAAIFLTCNLELFASEFGLWTRDDVENCWKV